MMRFFRRFKDLAVEGAQASFYDKNSREYRMPETKEEAVEVSRHLKPGDSVLEIAMGPGYLSIELSKTGKYKVTGIDISGDLVAIAIRNAKEAGVGVDFLQGNVSCLPFQENTFNFIICVLSFKNFMEPVIALNEMYRVLKPGGMVLIMDLNRNAPKQAMKEFVKGFGLKGVSAFIARIIQTNGAYTRQEFETFIAQTEFKDCAINETKMGFSIYMKK